MLWLREPRALGALLLVLAGPSALAQAPGAASPPVRIVVYQFTIAKNDAELGMVGSAITRAMVQQLAGDPAFLVMSHPRAERNRSGTARGNAQYAVVGGIAERNRMVRIDARIVDVEKVQLVVRETLSLSDTDPQLVKTAAARLADWVHQRLATKPR